jgi:hypothetical protein
MTLIERIENITRLWGMMLPSIPAPPPVWIGRWSCYPDAAIEQGVVRASKRFSAERTGNILPMPEDVWRYAGGVAANEAKQISSGIPERVTAR